jgi:hypothetical protein
MYIYIYIYIYIYYITRLRVRFIVSQHSQQTDIQALGGIRTRNPNRGAAANPRLRPGGHWDRLYVI